MFVRSMADAVIAMSSPSSACTFVPLSCFLLTRPKRLPHLPVAATDDVPEQIGTIFAFWHVHAGWPQLRVTTDALGREQVCRQKNRQAVMALLFSICVPEHPRARAARSVRVSAETRSTSESLAALGTAAARPPPALAEQPTLVVPNGPPGGGGGGVVLVCYPLQRKNRDGVGVTGRRFINSSSMSGANPGAVVSWVGCKREQLHPRRQCVPKSEPSQHSIEALVNEVTRADTLITGGFTLLTRDRERFRDV